MIVPADPVAAAIHRAILEDPADDLPRLAMADWWAENGQPERAEFVRAEGEGVWSAFCGCYVALMNDILAALLGLRPVPDLRFCGFGREQDDPRRPYLRFGWKSAHEGSPSIEHSVFFYPRRGFVESVTLPLDAFMTHAEALFREHPITEVRLSDRGPSGTDDYWWWYNGDSPLRRAPSGEHHLPARLSALLLGGEVEGPSITYPSRGAALNALSRACVAYGRNLADLPRLPQ